MSGPPVFVGVDAGSTRAKFVALDETGRVLHAAIEAIRGDPAPIVAGGLKRLRKVVGVKKKHLRVGLTGRNAEFYAKRGQALNEFACLAAGCLVQDPAVRTVISIGSFTLKALKTDATGAVLDYLVNDVCSSGAGIFLELVCKSLDLTLDQLDELARTAEHPVPISSQCSIFAETEVIYLMNEGKALADIAAGVCRSIVGRIVPLVAKIGVEPPVMLVGGVARNRAIREALEAQLDARLVIPSLDPRLVGAIGAARRVAGAEMKPGGEDL